MKIVRKPKVYLVGRSQAISEGLTGFIKDHNTTWEHDTEKGPEILCEAAGRICYMSYGRGRKSNQEYLKNILDSGHGSVLEHVTWNFILTGVSRSLTHELVRHRAGFAYSQLSQRYVSEDDTDFVEPEAIATDPELHEAWLKCVEGSRQAYIRLVDGLSKKFENIQDKTLRRKMARQAARSVLPNATETKIFVTANARAWRHFIELRGGEHADIEIRGLAVELLKILQRESQNIFGDFTLQTLADGSEAVATTHHKV